MLRKTMMVLATAAVLSVPIGIRVIGEGNPIAVLEADESGHRIWTGAVHANDAVVVDGHERKGRINPRIHDCDLQSVGGIDRLPIIDGGAAKRVDRETELSGVNGVHVDHVAQIVDIGKDDSSARNDRFIKPDTD
jgi:hypothetical protein